MQPKPLADVVRRKIALPDRGLELALLDWGGDGPLVLLHHATGFCAATLGIVAEKLSATHRVIALDARGHGDSSILEASPENYHWDQFGDDLVALARGLINDLGYDQIDIAVGHSFGGTATLLAAEKDPDIFRRVAMLDPVIFSKSQRQGQSLGTSPAKKPGYDMAEGARRRRALWPSKDAVRSAWTAKKFFQIWDRRVLELYIKEGFRSRSDGQVELKCSPEIEARVFEMSGSADVFSRATDVQIPVLILHATQGNFDVELYKRLAASMPRGQVEEFPSGHLMPMEAPNEVADRLLRFGLEG